MNGCWELRVQRRLKLVLFVVLNTHTDKHTHTHTYTGHINQNNMHASGVGKLSLYRDFLCPPPTFAWRCACIAISISVRTSDTIKHLGKNRSHFDFILIKPFVYRWPRGIWQFYVSFANNFSRSIGLSCVVLGRSGAWMPSLCVHEKTKRIERQMVQRESFMWLCCYDIVDVVWLCIVCLMFGLVAKVGT